MRNPRKKSLLTGQAVMGALFTVLVLAALVGGSSAAVIADHAGRSVRFEKPFSRIISLYGAHTENLVMLGLDAEVIGISGSDRATGLLKSRSVFSYHDDPEKFIAVRPGRDEFFRVVVIGKNRPGFQQARGTVTA